MARPRVCLRRDCARRDDAGHERLPRLLSPAYRRDLDPGPRPRRVAVLSIPIVRSK